MFISSFLRCKDTGVSRPSKVRGTFLPQEYSLAQFVANIHNPHESWTANTTACEWKGVSCDKNQNVIAIEIGMSRYAAPEYYGTLAWGYMPGSIQTCEISRSGISGILPVRELPAALNIFRVPNCDLFGNLDMTVLPPALTTLNLNGNRFKGSLDLMSLPPNLVVLELNRNCFEGPVDFSRLPVHLKNVDLRRNKIM